MISRASSLPFLALVAAAAAFACSDSTLSVSADRIPPTVSVAADSNTDSTIAYSVHARDNIGLKSIHVSTSGGVNRSYDTTFTSAVTDITVPIEYPVSASVPGGAPILVIASAVDGAGNSSGPDTLNLTAGNLPPAVAKVTSPVDGSFAVIGKSIVVAVSGTSQAMIRSLGVVASGSFAHRDSTVFNSPLLDSTAIQDTLLIPETATAGPLVLTPFIVDSLGVRALGDPVTVTVQTTADANSVPVVSFGLTKRIEAGDTVHVEATDPAGITTLGYEFRNSTGGAVAAADSIVSGGQLTSAINTFRMHLPYTTFPDTVYVQAFATNSVGTRAYAKSAAGFTVVDTVIVVAGATRPLPLGGAVADAFYHPGRDRLYLTNTELNRVEVFSLQDSSFKPAISVGSRPWGLAPWPRNRRGDIGDTLLVANSGGTDISYVNVRGAGSEVRRYALPNIIVYTVTTTKNADGVFFQQRTVHDFSDRPQYLAATCESSAGTCDNVIVVYSTTPTGGQSPPFTTRNGTLRWENLTAHTSHFFFEQAIGQAAGRSDTLEIVRFDGRQPRDSTILVPIGRSIVVNIDRLGFRDTTFVRNSGNFRRAIVAEGGAVLGSRALSYDVSGGVSNFIDVGISGAANVSDFIANTFQTVTGAGINFDGSLSAVRGDSTYVINPLLRLQGIFETRAGPGGVDFHPCNVAPGSPSPASCSSFSTLATRLAFAASTGPEIEIYDTNCYARVGTIQIRDPIIGPLKAAQRSNGTLMLIGATAHGVVITELPDTFTTSCP